jgi:hypothetical protein
VIFGTNSRHPGIECGSSFGRSAAQCHTPSGRADGGFRTRNEVEDGETFGAIAKMASVERVTLHEQNAQHIASLAVRDLVFFAKPPQLLQRMSSGGTRRVSGRDGL